VQCNLLFQEEKSAKFGQHSVHITPGTVILLRQCYVSHTGKSDSRPAARKK
jgi:hypothetical protein